MYYFRFFISWILVSLSFVILICPISILAAFFPHQIRLFLTAPFWQIFSKLTFFILNIKVVALDERKSSLKKLHSPPGLYISNHQSMLDIPLLLQFFQAPPIMKSSVLKIPVFGICAYSAGALTVDRKNPDSRKKVLKDSIKRLTNYQKCLQYYPEGTRNKEALHPKSFEQIKTPLLRFAYQNNIPVYAVSLAGTRSVMEGGARVKFGSKVGIKITSEIHSSSHQSEEEFLKYCWSKVQQGYDEISASL